LKFFSGGTIYKDDQGYLKIYLKHSTPMKTLGNNSIRVRFDRGKLHAKKISLEDIVLSITERFPETHIIPLGETVIRIYVQMLYVTDRTKNELDILKEIYSTLDSIKLTGIDGINGVQFNEVKIRRYEEETRKEIIESEYILYTNGINLFEVFKLPYIDHLRTISNEVNEVSQILGIEAARRVLMENLYSVILNNSADINRHFLHLLVDFMTHTGSFVPINIYGINSAPKIEPLQKITFERPEDGFVKAAIRGSVDSMSSMGSNVITCHQGKYGKGLFNVLMKNS
jgi:DNA-directed RNA polymerase beta' subunit